MTAMDDGGHWRLMVAMDSSNSSDSERMKIAFDGGRDGQRQGGGEMAVTKIVFGSGGSG